MQDGVVKLNGTWFPLLTSDKAVFAEPARPKGTTGLHPKKKPPPPPPYPKPPGVEPPEDVFQHRRHAPAEQAPVADTVEDAATNTQPEATPAEQAPAADIVEDAATSTQPEAPPAEQAQAADKVEDAATNTQPEAQAQSKSVPTTETHRTKRPTPDVIPSATYAPPPPPESEYMQNTERPPSPPPEQRGEEQRDDESHNQKNWTTGNARGAGTRRARLGGLASEIPGLSM